MIRPVANGILDPQSWADGLGAFQPAFEIHREAGKLAARRRRE